MIRSEMLKPKVALRIIGRSGLGKTRVAFEAFKPPERAADDSTQAILSGSVAYVDFLDEEHTVVNLVSQLRGRGAAGVIVVDNCPEDVHERLVDHITHENSRLSLL